VTPEQLLAFAKLVVRHETIIGALAQNAADSSVLMAQLLKPCTRCSKQPATVTNEHLGELSCVCDRCAAEVAVNAAKHFTADLDDPLNLLRGSLMREEDWHDVPHADKVRRLMDYVNVLQLLDGAEPAVH
jgi:hypothetical protein